jgi:hypothetical protein
MYQKALQIHLSSAMLRDEIQAAQMSLIRDRPPCRHCRDVDSLKGAMKEISVECVTFFKCRTMNLGDARGAALHGHCTVTVRFGARSCVGIEILIADEWACLN